MGLGKMQFKGVRFKDKLLLAYIRKIPNHPFKVRLVNKLNDIFFDNSVILTNESNSSFHFSTREYIGYTIMVQDSYEPLTLKMASEILKNGGTLVDVGANIGLISIPASKLPNVTVFAVEPSVKNFQKLLQNIKENRCTNITPINIALSYEDSFGYLFDEFADNAGTPKVVETDKGADSYLIKLSTLSALMKHLGVKQIDLLKIDVEGYEINVLKGLFKNGNTLFPKNLILEYGPQIERTGYNITELFKYFTDLGYAPFDVEGRPYVYPSFMPEDNLLFKYIN